jgi:tetratricopeptide (TPR) repeat protein
VSDAGDKPARTIVWELEQVRAEVTAFWPWAKTDLDRPILVLVARDENGMKSLAPRFWETKGSIHPASVFVSAPDHHFIALRADATASDNGGVVNPYQTAYWSYLALVLRSSNYQQLPLWFSLGLTEVMSNTIVRENRIEIGRTIPWHLQRLRERIRIPLRELLSLTTASPWYIQESQRPDLDAEAWALVHYLMFGDEGTHRAQFDRFAQLVTEGKTASAATELVFGDLTALERGFQTYAGHQVFLFARYDVNVAIKRETFAARALTPAETAVSQAAWHTAMRRPVEARRLVDEARKSDARLPGPFEVDGRLLDGDGKFDEARTAYGHAIELESKDFYSHYRWATLTAAPGMKDDETRTRVDRALDQAMTLNDRFPPTYAMMAQVRLMLGRRDEALDLARRGVVLDPTRLDNRLALARVLWTLSRRDEAIRQAREALALAQSDNERRVAQELLDFFAKNSSA